VYMMTQKGDPYTRLFSTSSEVIHDMHFVIVKYSLQQSDKTVHY